MRVKWERRLPLAREIINSYDTGVTLRQLFYRLVSEGVIPNTQSYYVQLNNKSAKARRAGTLPDLIAQRSYILYMRDFVNRGGAFVPILSQGRFRSAVSCRKLSKIALMSKSMKIVDFAFSCVKLRLVRHTQDLPLAERASFLINVELIQRK